MGAKITEAACRWAVGKPIVRINSKGQREKVYPSGDQMQTSQKLVLERLVAVRRHTELTGAEGKDLIPHPEEEPTPRDLGRAVLSILEKAKLADSTDGEPAPARPEQLLIGRDDVIELNAVSNPSVSAMTVALKDGASGGMGRHSEAPSPTNGTDASTATGGGVGNGGTAGEAVASSASEDEETHRIGNRGAYIQYSAEAKRWRVFNFEDTHAGSRYLRSDAEELARAQAGPSLMTINGGGQPAQIEEVRADQREFGPRSPQVLRRRSR